jgi:hypothetical protein
MHLHLADTQELAAVRFDPHRSAAEGQEEASAGGGAVNVLVTNGELVPTVAKLLVFDMFKVAPPRLLARPLYHPAASPWPQLAACVPTLGAAGLVLVLLRRCCSQWCALVRVWHTRHTVVGKPV